MFGIGRKHKWPGFSKLNEECGELIQVIGKFMGSDGEINHWSGNLLDKLYEEMGDVQAAIWLVTDKCKLDHRRILTQATYKLKRFNYWFDNDTTVVSLNEKYECTCTFGNRGREDMCDECLKRGH